MAGVASVRGRRPGLEVGVGFEAALSRVALLGNLILENRSPAAAFHIRARRKRGEMARGTEGAQDGPPGARGERSWEHLLLALLPRSSSSRGDRLGGWAPGRGVSPVPAGHLPPVIAQRLGAGQERVLGPQQRRLLRLVVYSGCAKRARSLEPGPPPSGSAGGTWRAAGRGAEVAARWAHGQPGGRSRGRSRRR